MKRININHDWSRQDFHASSAAYRNKATNRKAVTEGGERNGSAAATKSTVDHAQLLVLFENELKNVYWAEKALTTTIPKMVKYAGAQALVATLEAHLDETSEQVTRLEDVFEIIGRNPNAKKCEEMDGLIKEAEALIIECEAGAMRDAGIIFAAQKIAQAEIASYTTLRQFAETLGLYDAADLLATSLEEERQRLNQLAQ